MSSNLVVIAFEGIETATEMLREVQEMEKDGNIDLEDAVVVERRQGNTVDVKQVKSPEWKATGRGTAIGLVGGLLLGGPLVGAMLGAAFGHIVGKMRDYGIDDHFVRQVSESLGPDSSALFLLVKQTNVEAAKATLQKFQGRVLSTTLDPEREAELRKALQ